MSRQVEERNILAGCQRSEMDDVRRGDFGGVGVGAHHGCWVAQKREMRGDAANAERGNRKLSVRMREKGRRTYLS